jgi:putative acetyltransferase
MVSNTQSFRVREAVETDAEAVARVLFEAIHGSASRYYSSEVIASWARVPDELRCSQIRRAIAGTDELCLVAEHKGEVVGFGSIVPSLSELRALYVRTDVGRRGVGAAILHDLERMAVARGLSELHMDASINAEVFYQRHGYQVIERGEHRLANGAQMACVKMRKPLPEDKRS